MGGNPKSQFDLAMYFNKVAEPEAQERSTYWLDQAAKQGHHESCMHLSNKYIKSGEHLKAIEYLRFATPSKDAVVESVLAQMLINLYTGYIHSTKQSHELGQSELDQYIKSLYTDSLLKTQQSLNITESEANACLSEAKTHIQVAIAKDNLLAKHTWAVFNLDYVEDLTPTEIKEFIDLLQYSADHDFSPSLQVLAGIYENGIYGVKQDVNRGLVLRVKAAQTGSKESQFTLGVLVYQGNGFEQDREKGLHLIKMAAEKGHIEAISYLAEINEHPLLFV